MNLKLTLRQRTLLGAGLGLLAASVIFMLGHLLPFTARILQRFEAETLDLRYLARIQHLQERRRGAPLEEVVIIDIDERSQEKLGNFARWPRSHHARILEYLHAEGAAVVCFDILFLNHNPAEAAADSIFAAKVQQAANVVNAVMFTAADVDRFRYPMREPPAAFAAERFALALPADARQNFPQQNRLEGEWFTLYNNSARLGFANFLPEDDDTIRRMPLFMNFAGRTFPSLPLAVVMQVTGTARDQVRVLPGREVRLAAGLRIPIDEKGRMLINYAGGFGSFRYVPYVDVLERRLPAGFFTGKIVLIGTSAPGLYDLRVVPFQADFPGVEIHANIIHNILTQDFLAEQSLPARLLTLAIVGVLAGVIALLLNPWMSILFTLACGCAYAWFSFWAFVLRQSWFILVEPVQVMVLALLLAMIFRYRNEEREKKLIYGMFGNYLSDIFVREMLRHPERLRLGGEHKQATAFFSDIKDFTAISEKLVPEALIRQLNEYLSAMTEIVLQYGGYLDKYEGDAIMAVFGVPVDQPDHAVRACFAALDMQQQLIRLRQQWRKERRPLLEARMGINSGAMIAGNIGGRERADYTVIGDSVNLASRLEGVNKLYATSILISEATHELVKTRVIARELDFIRVKGKQRPVRIYELVARRDQGIGQEVAAAFTHYARGLEFYRQQQWQKAIAEFRRVLHLRKNDGPATALLQRCEILLQAPPPSNWDGVFEMPGK
ncbi:MAG: adenylate/guanylate cyclase domain-containing protein [candidate division KSB1 bacterium]|nr:adenylate/guanylate cyclase domain-containing protein [candidate division KSB1 bacterium]MDZ7276413.1 adenylate/guanylate cyclase domain-containing protein [candidate division KSB1 bacterium]MDZ7288084.1 adenylate/guanylate cyclase domain-containing protein [candidate division KSB1 bacterium]MDZ7300184.1 adenylate/guanylate cyclase domain-containing protein [candidate division KSB1 bacterium]MDZ7305756.1 adenylate/guanylate cyclase domain-containing protein [candidate division KSB1 bacterium